jgi:hypothetical protein
MRYNFAVWLIVLVAIGLFVTWMSLFRWAILVLAVIWSAFVVGNVIIFLTWFMRSAKRGEKWFAAALLFGFAILLVIHFMTPCAIIQ